MSGIFDLIKNSIGQQAIQAVTNQIGGNKDAGQRAVAAAIPMLLSALQKNSQSETGAQSLANALDKDHDGGILGSLGSMFGQSQNQSMGEKILGHVLGGRQQNVTSQLGQATGLGGSDITKILANLAPAVMGAVGQVKKQQNLDASGLQNLLSQERNSIQQKQTNLGFF